MPHLPELWHQTSPLSQTQDSTALTKREADRDPFLIAFIKGVKNDRMGIWNALKHGFYSRIPLIEVQLVIRE